MIQYTLYCLAISPFSISFFVQRLTVVTGILSKLDITLYEDLPYSALIKSSAILRTSGEYGERSDFTLSSGTGVSSSAAVSLAEVALFDSQFASSGGVSNRDKYYFFNLANHFIMFANLLVDLE